MIGFAREGSNLKTAHVGSVANSWSYYSNNGQKYISGANTPFGPPAKKGDTITLKLNTGTNIVKFYKNNILFGSMGGILHNNNISFFRH